MPNLEQLEVDDFLDIIRDGLGSEAPLAYWLNQGRCPNNHGNRVSGFGPANPSCALCGGSGVLLVRQEIPINNASNGNVLVDNVILGRTKAPIELEAGDAVITYFPEDYPMNGGDRMVFSSRWRTTNQLIQRGGTGTFDVLNPHCIKRVLALTLPTGPLTYGFRANTFDDGITWTDPSVTPAAGTSYTVLYEFYPLWQIKEGGHSTELADINNRPLPRTCIASTVKFASTDGSFSLAGG